MSHREIRLAILPGDGIGPEVIRESVRVLDTISKLDRDLSIAKTYFDWGSERYLKQGSMMPGDALEQLQRGKFDAILLGPVGDPRIPDHVTLWGLLLPIRQHFDQYVNLRPMRLLQGVDSPLRNSTEIDMVCVRENTEGEYAGVGGRVHAGKRADLAIQSVVFTRTGTERIIRFAFEWARTHGRKRVTSATKSNSMQHNMVFWDEIFREIAREYPEISTDQQLIDSFTARMVQSPQSVDVFVGSNLFGDILSDLGAAVTGSLGLAPSANINPERNYPSLFQAVHGTAPDIAGKGIANPIASIWSLQLMFDFLGEDRWAGSLMKAIEEVLRERTCRTPDLGGKHSTTDLGVAICEALTAATGLASAAS
ncbi:MAG TPA: tartrate dehydrogenase [Bryobacteraceae bacterium]|nr:tartrate dehydrogenase [Bryobacteraceae bacterium]